MILYKFFSVFNGEDTEMFADRTGKCDRAGIDGDARKYDLFMAPDYAYACIYKDPMTGVLSTNYLHQTPLDAKANRLPDTEDREFFCHARIEMFFKEEQEGGVNEE